MAYKTFANGFPLPASDLNNYLMNQSVIVFANATERSTTLTSPTEGMVTYLEDTDTVEVYNGTAWTDINDNTAAVPKSTVTAQGDLIVADGASSVTNLGVGANGSLLYSDGTDPSWLANSGTEGDVLQVSATGGLEFATPSGGGGWTLLGSTALSGNTTLTTGIDQSYKFLKIVVEGLITSGTGYVGVTLQNSAYGSLNNRLIQNDASATPNWNFNLLSNINIMNYADLNSGIPTSFEMTVTNYADLVTKSWLLYGGGYYLSKTTGFIQAGMTYIAEAIDEVRISHFGVATAGTVYFYGSN